MVGESLRWMSVENPITEPRVESRTLSRLAAAVGLAPEVKFSCGKAQLYFTFEFGYPEQVRYGTRTAVRVRSHGIGGTGKVN